MKKLEKIARTTGARTARIKNDIMKYHTNTGVHYLSIHTPSGREISATEIIAMVQCNM